jgi:hypothetical protein
MTESRTYSPRTGELNPRDGYVVKTSKPRRMRHPVVTRMATSDDLERLGHKVTGRSIVANQVGIDL